jgi:hypothetical protein
MKKENMKEEFLEFLSSEPISPPKEISQSIIEIVSRDLNPTPISVFFKIAIIHLIMGTITLVFCPQFGLGFLSGMGIMHFFMSLGSLGCSILCGSLFLGFSALTISFILRPEEIRVVRKNELFQISLLAILSLLIFFIFGEVIVPGLTMAWLLGGILMGIFSLETGWFLRKTLLN